MKQTFILCLLALSSVIVRAQIYDSAVHYRMTTPSFHAAMDTLIARAVNPSDTSDETDASVLTRQKEFMGNRISLDVPLGGEYFQNF